MKLALHLYKLTWDGGPAATARTLADAARTADEGGVDTITMMDHWFQMEHAGGPFEPMLEGYTSLGYLAGLTRNVDLGLLVTGVTYRHPGLLAKTVTTLDVLSEGRAFLGIGAAWYDREHRGLGVPYPPTAERFERLEETLQICRQMWSDDDGPYTGKHYQLAETLCDPRPISSPRPRVLIGGGGERKTLRLVAQYADACNLSGSDVDEVRHKIEVLEQHCADVGRDPSEIEKTIIAVSAGDPVTDTDAFLRSMGEFAALGVDRVWVGTAEPNPLPWIKSLVCDVVPRLSDV